MSLLEAPSSRLTTLRLAVISIRGVLATSEQLLGPGLSSLSFCFPRLERSSTTASSRAVALLSYLLYDPDVIGLAAVLEAV
ncbi:hypothetical protein FRB94_001156 [Tulasnella sp. JGI-2019a]|nr:hypothetical protein FRB94_001156 [Tulasnella sp. JGI-2019a]